MGKIPEFGATLADGLVSRVDVLKDEFRLQTPKEISSALNIARGEQEVADAKRVAEAEAAYIRRKYSR
jgi:hypothetical protein